MKQEFTNPYQKKIEAVYVFPLPHDAAVNEFIMTIGERRIRGIIRERAMTCVIVTHNKPQAERIAARAMLMESGKLVAVGPTREVLNAD